MNNFLDKVLPVKQQEVKQLKLKQKINRFADLFKEKELVIIAEIKPKSPSAGLLLNGDPVDLAQTYEQAGADAISVLTDETFFGGSTDLFRKIRSKVTIPLLRKEFILDESQIIESLALGADVILLIVKLLKPKKLKDLLLFTQKLGTIPLVEVTDLDELSVALKAGADFIGVNSRDLQTMQINTGKALKVLSHIPLSKKRLFFSGIENYSDVQEALVHGAQGVLVGTSLLRSSDPGMKIKSLRGIKDEN